MVSLNTQNASQALSRLLRDASVQSKGLQIADAMTSPDKKIALKPDEVQSLLAHVEKLPAADKTSAVACLDLFRDRFEIADPAAKKLFLDFVPKTATPIEIGGKVRTVAEAHAQSVTPPVTASAADIKDADKAIDGMRKAAGPHSEGMAADAAAALKAPFDDGQVKANPEGGGRKAYVEGQAKRADLPPPPTPPSTQAKPGQGGVMKLFDEYARSPFFEDRLMAALGKNSLRFMNEMNDKLASFDDPKREDDIRAEHKAGMTKMLEQADRLSPEGKARCAQQLLELAKTNPDLGGSEKPALMEWLEKAKAAAPPAGTSPHELLDKLPPIDNTVIDAMADSNRGDVRGWSTVFKAADTAEQLKALPADVSTLSEDQVRAVHANADKLAGQLNALKSKLPPDMQKDIGDIKLDGLPAAIDPSSRQVMFQQVNLMMNQYQQIMQAMSEVINKMNEMAMDPIRRMGR